MSDAASQSDNDNALLTRLGGPPAVAEIVKDMYQRILADPELASFFANTSIERLAHMQYEFIVSALGGPITYSGAELTAVHRNRGITGHHFARFCGHFADAMEERGIAPQVVDQALGRLATFKNKITGDTSIDG